MKKLHSLKYKTVFTVLEKNKAVYNDAYNYSRVTIIDNSD